MRTIKQLFKKMKLVCPCNNKEMMTIVLISRLIDKWVSFCYSFLSRTNMKIQLMSETKNKYISVLLFLLLLFLLCAQFIVKFNMLIF